MDIWEAVKRTYIYRYFAYRIHKYQVEKNPLGEINRYHNAIFCRDANLNEPKSLIEKIYWMQLNTDTSKWSLCADKYRMRDYVKEKGVGEYLPKIYGKWEKAEEIDFSFLPESFVLKTNNACHTVIVVKDKRKLNVRKTIKTLNQWLAIPFGYSGYEPHYLKITPCIIAEEYLTDVVDGDNNQRSCITDYKVWCFSGIPEAIHVIYDRIDDTIQMALYDTGWNDISYNIKNTSTCMTEKGVEVEKPKCLDKMLEIAHILSAGFPECRVDFYVIHNKPVIGELTFSTGYGYFTDDYYDYLGSKIDIDKLK